MKTCVSVRDLLLGFYVRRGRESLVGMCMCVCVCMDEFIS